MRIIAAIFAVVLSAVVAAVIVTVWTYEAPARFNDRFGMWSQPIMGNRLHEWDPRRAYACTRQVAARSST